MPEGVGIGLVPPHLFDELGNATIARIVGVPGDQFALCAATDLDQAIGKIVNEEPLAIVNEIAVAVVELRGSAELGVLVHRIHGLIVSLGDRKARFQSPRL